MRSRLLFYRKLRSDLEVYGFKINPYEPCVGKKIVMTETVVPVIDKKGISESLHPQRGHILTNCGK